MTNLAQKLGISFKSSKDVGFDKPTQELEFLGTHI